MSDKKWSITLISIVVLTLVGFAGMMYWLDPLLHYGPESEPLTCYVYVEKYSNPGIAKHYKYDSVLVGSSIIRNTDVDLCEELWDCDMVRLSYSGASTCDMKTILDICFESGNDIKTVYWEVNQFQLNGNPTKPRYTLPTYLYRYDHKEDVSYLLNLDIFYQFAYKDIKGTLKGKEMKAERRGITLKYSTPIEEYVKQYKHAEFQGVPVDFETDMKPNVKANVDNIENMVKAHPDTEFVFFVGPFSILHWDMEVQWGKFEAWMDAYEYAIGRLIEHDNVRFYCYLQEEEIITNMDNYIEVTHYGNWINDKVTEFIAEDRKRMTKENYQETIQGMKDFVYGFDYETIIP